MFEPWFVGQEAVAVGIDELDDVERLAPVPRLCGGEPLTPHLEVDGGEAAAQLVVEHADQLGVDRDLRPVATKVGDEPEQSPGGNRREPEHDDVGEAGVVGEPDGVGVPGQRWVGRRVRRDRLDCEPLRLHHPLDLLAVWEVEVRQLHDVRRYRPTAPVPSAAAMYRFLFRPRWILFHLLCIGAVVAMINLGFWQLRRLEERRDFNARVESRIDEPAMPIDDVTEGEIEELEWRSIAATGEYLPDEQLVVVNRSQQGSAGDIVVTPLQLTDGRILLVERGFVPLGVEPDEVAAAPTGTVDVVGRLRPPEVRRRGQLSDAETGDLTEAQRVDIERLAPQLPGPVVPAYIELVSSQPAEASPFPIPLEQPELSEGPHLSYAGQWFLFAAAVVVGWVLAVRHSVKARRGGASTPKASSPAPAGEPAAGVGAAPPSSPG